ncbi:hypothetical protein SYNPS1DRAFT_26302 [Syncephalis pseudoplumigaleata]|uniref:C2H2-type domain-containing protein n=1 Tax=Syncephalis pseudoplumigaleata TaxID=1712513 RepID=A0A4P9Z630_9FUNG|nr:hypothetical protein SYNPS1DRAFT_26302 [Syncephalis pseudoplumigaleata]|eukprot:RKP28113.1 hypothetical protein SYNPS1DRAFT_26302 [Syncephalis pseudoplumigaleata]
MPAPVDIILSQKKQQQQEELGLQVSQGSLTRDSAFDFYDFTPAVLDAAESSSDDDYYPHDLEANFCRDFSCCGLVLRDLHDLLQHYEECHVRFEEEDQHHPHHPTAMGYAPHAIDDWQAAASDESRPGSPLPVREALMARQLSAAAALKRQSLSATAAAAAMSGVNLNDVLSQQQHHHPSAGLEFDMVDPMDTTLLGRKRTASAMNDAAMHHDGSSHKRMATGAVPVPLSPAPMQQQTFVDDELLLAALLQIGSGNMGTEEMLQDALLLQQQLLLNGRNAALASNLSASTAAAAGMADPMAAANQHYQHGNNSGSNASATGSSSASVANGGSRAHTPRPIATPVSMSARASSTGSAACASSVERPYRCAVPGCEKSYKNANGLKYHNLHGHCNGTANTSAAANAGNGSTSTATIHTSMPVVNPIMHASDNGASAGSNGAMANTARGVPVKPYRCTIPECGKSYKNLNGLKYHVEHAHPGAVALPLGKKAHVKAAATVIAQAQERLQMPNIKAVVVPAHMACGLVGAGLYFFYSVCTPALLYGLVYEIPIDDF